MAKDTISQTLSDPATRDRINELADRLGVKPSRLLETLIQGHGVAALATYFPASGELDGTAENANGIVLLGDDQVAKIASAIISSAVPVFKEELAAISKTAIQQAVRDYLQVNGN